MLVLAAGFLVLAGIFKRRGWNKKLSPGQNPFAAVSIVFDDTKACAEVMKYSGQRLLRGDAPKLPLRGCSAKKCTCSFHHFTDRRKGSRRGDETGIFTSTFQGSNRRLKNRGRRAEDSPRGAAPRELKDSHSDTYFDFNKKTDTF
jgi:hypothetical protein